MTDVPRGIFEIRNASIDELDEVVDVVLSAYIEYSEFIVEVLRYNHLFFKIL